MYTAVPWKHALNNHLRQPLVLSSLRPVTLQEWHSCLRTAIGFTLFKVQGLIFPHHSHGPLPQRKSIFMVFVYLVWQVALLQVSICQFHSPLLLGQHHSKVNVIFTLCKAPVINFWCFQCCTMCIQLTVPLVIASAVSCHTIFCHQYTHVVSLTME